MRLLRKLKIKFTMPRFLAVGILFFAYIIVTCYILFSIGINYQSIKEVPTNLNVLTYQSIYQSKRIAALQQMLQMKIAQSLKIVSVGQSETKQAFKPALEYQQKLYQLERQQEELVRKISSQQRAIIESRLGQQNTQEVTQEEVGQKDPFLLLKEYQTITQLESNLIENLETQITQYNKLTSGTLVDLR